MTKENKRGRQMICLATLALMKEHQQDEEEKEMFVRRRRRQSRSANCLLIFVAFLFYCCKPILSVHAVGPHCNQVGHGPEDIIMASGRINPKYTWYKRGHKTYVPVVMDPTYSHKEHSIITGGLSEIMKKTCVEFEYYEEEHSLQGKDYVYITRQTNRGCWSYIGRIGRGKQEIGLPPGCITHRTAMHEMMHALGFRHEHVRYDRDDYIKIYWANIKRGRESNFQKRSSENSVGPYDYDSIMHYERKAFSKNKMDTIRPLKPGVRIGVRQKMSYWDAKKINIMYGCHAGGGGGGHLSWSPEFDHHDADPDDFLAGLPKNASSSPPASSEIEVAYDDLDYDPIGPRREPRYHSGEENYFARDDHHNGHQSPYPNSNRNNNHNSFFGPHRQNDEQNERDHFPSFNEHSPQARQYQGGGLHNEFSLNSNYYPQSFSIFELDTYPGGGHESSDNDGGRSAQMSGEIAENVDFYDI